MKKILLKAGLILFVSLAISRIALADIPVRPAGTNGQIQFNRKGVFGANADLYFSTDTKTLHVPAIDCPGCSFGGGGGASSLEVFNIFNATRSSPTASIGLSDAFRGTVTGSTYTFQLNSSSVTEYGPNIPSSAISAGALGSSVRASSVSVNAIVNANIVSMDGSKITGTASIPNASIDGSSITKFGASIPASAIAAGSLGSSVISSSIGVNSVQDASIVGVGGAKITGTATIPNAAIDGSSITKYGASIPANSVAAGSLGSSVIASSIAVSAVQDASIVAVGGAKITGTATVPNAAIDGSSITKQGVATAGQNISVTNGAGTHTIAITGTIPAANIPSTVTYTNAANTFTPTQTFSGGLVTSTAAITTLGPGPLKLAIGTSQYYTATISPSSDVAAGIFPATVQGSSLAVSGFFSDATVRSNLGLAIGTNVQAWDADLDDLADGSLTGSKIGSGVPAENIATGVLGSQVRASSFPATAVTAGAYTNANVTFNAQGLATAASNGIDQNNLNNYVSTNPLSMGSNGIYNIGSTSSSFSAGGGLVVQSTVAVNGGLYVSALVKTSAYTMKSTDTVVLASCTAAGGCTITLPGVADTNQVLTITKVDTSSQSVKVVTAVSTDLIFSTNTIWLHAHQANLKIVSDGGRWQTLGHIPNIPPFLGYAADPNSAQAVATSSNVNYVAIYVPEPCTAYGLQSVYSGTISGTVDAGIYDSDPVTGKPNNKLASSGILKIVNGVFQSSFTTQVNLLPGNYWMALDVSNVGVTVARFGIDTYMGALVSASTSATLPATAASTSATGARVWSTVVLLRHSVDGT